MAREFQASHMPHDQPPGPSRRSVPFDPMAPRLGGALTVPNALSLLRIVLIAPFLAYYFDDRVEVAAVLFAVAAASDVLDGLLARLLKQRSALGAILDPLADKLLGLAALVALVGHGRLPEWLLVLSLTRDAVVLVIGLVAKAKEVRVPVRPSRVGKYATFFSYVAVILALIGEITYAPELAGYVMAAAIVAGECLLISSVQYAWRYATLDRGR